MCPAVQVTLLTVAVSAASLRLFTAAMKSVSGAAAKRETGRQRTSVVTRDRRYRMGGADCSLRIESHATDRARRTVDARVEQFAEIGRLDEHVPVPDAMDGDGKEEHGHHCEEAQRRG